MAHKKGVGSSRNGRDSNSQRLGLKKFGGEKVDIEALFVSTDGKVSLGGATVKATVVGHGRADKIIVFKKKRRKQYKRKQGHRQGYTEITIEKI